MDTSFRNLSMLRLALVVAAPCLFLLATLNAWADPPQPGENPAPITTGRVAELGVVVVDSPGVGVLVQSVIAGLPADAAGVTSGDFIMAIDGNAVTEPGDLANAIRAKNVGSTVAVDLWRDGQEVVKQVRLTTSRTVPASDRAWLGLQLRSTGQQGARIESVVPGSPAARAQLRSGDVVTMIDDTLVANVNELIDAIGRHRPGDVVPLTVQRDGQELAFKIELGSFADRPVFSFRTPLGGDRNHLTFPAEPMIPVPVDPTLDAWSPWRDDIQKLQLEVERLREQLRNATAEQAESPATAPSDTPSNSEVTPNPEVD